MQVRLASADGERRLILPAARVLPLVAALIASFAAAACHSPARDLSFEWTLSPRPPAVDRPAALSLRLLDAERRGVSGAKLTLEAHMSHPGMAPVVVPVRELEDGVYAASFRLTMAGDWILLVSGSLADGTTVQHRIDMPGVKANE